MPDGEDIAKRPNDAPDTKIVAHPAAAAATEGASSDRGSAPDTGSGLTFQPVKGERDPHGDLILRVCTTTQRFGIYVADDDRDPNDPPSLRFVLSKDYDVARTLRTKLIPVAGLIAYISDMIAGMKPWLVGRRTYGSLCGRTNELMARAMSFAFEDHEERARELLQRVSDEVEARRDSQNRMRYIAASTLSFLLIMALGYAVREFDVLGPLDQRFALVAGGEATLRGIDVLLFGAMGAFFSVALDIRSVKVNHSISLSEMLYAGSVRIPIGVIASAVVILMIAGNWILGSIEPSLKTWAAYLFGFLAGFSELFVPNALKQIEGETRPRSPGAGGGPDDGEPG